MDKNFIPQIENILGVKIGESFKVDGCHETYHLDEYLKVIVDGNGNVSNNIAVRTILNGECEIIKLPFKPKNGNDYWTVIGNGVAACSVWSNDMTDRLRLKHNMVFKTKEEALSNSKRIMKEIYED